LKTAVLHSSLFIITFVTTTLAGAEWVFGKSIFMPGYSWADFASGMSYSIPFLLILTAHEFGHYFMAIYHRVKTTLPYYIPLPPFPFMLGTLGALIRIKSQVQSKQQHFDIGIAGPLAGFVVAMGVLWYGFTHLPPPTYVFGFHPEYAQFGADYAQHVYRPENMLGTADVIIGKNLLFLFFENVVADPARVPNAHEMMHYPYLFAGFLSLVFTSINLLPIGQLDGGHVLYGLVGFRSHRIIASGAFILFAFFAGLGYVMPGQPVNIVGIELPHEAGILAFIGVLFLIFQGLMIGWKNELLVAVLVFAAQYFLVMWRPDIQGYPGWLLFVFLIGRFVRVPHPPSPIEAPLSPARQVLGWVALFIFVICFTPNPLEIRVFSTAAP